MSDFTELKKRVDEFLKEVKSFSADLKSGYDAKKLHQMYIGLQNKKKELAEEVKDFEPAKKITMLDSKKSNLLKALQDELTRTEKAMVKQKVEIPKDDEDDEDEEESTDLKEKDALKDGGKKSKKEDGKSKVGKKDGGKDKKNKGDNDQDDADQKDGSKKAKSSQSDKKGKNKVEIIDDDRKSTSSAKSKQSKSSKIVDNDFEDTEEEDEEAPRINKLEKQTKTSGAKAEKDERLEDADEDKISAAGKDKGDKKSGDKKDNKKKIADGDGSKQDKEGKHGDKKVRKDSEKSVADGKESKQSKEKDGKKKEESGSSKGLDEVDGKDTEEQINKIGKSKKDKRDKSLERKGSKKEKKSAKKPKVADAEEKRDKSLERKGSKKEKKSDKKSQVADAEEKAEATEDEDEEPEPDDKKDKRKSKEIKGEKEDKKGKKSKEDTKSKSKEPKETKEKKGAEKEEKETKDKKGTNKEEKEAKEKKGTKKEEKKPKETKEKKGTEKEEKEAKDKKSAKKEEKEPKETKEKKGTEKEEKEAKDKKSTKKEEKEPKETKEKKGTEKEGKEKGETTDMNQKGPKKSRKDSDNGSKESNEKVKKTEEAKEIVMIHQEPKQRAAAAESEDDFESEYEDEDEEENLQEESEDEEPTYARVIKQAAGAQSASMPKTSSQAPTPAPRQKPVELPSVAAAANLEDDDEEESQFEDEEDDEYEFEDMRTLGPSEPSRYEVLHAHSDPSDPDILSIRVGELLLVLKVGPSGWWLARNAQGREGLVPSTMLRLVRDEDSEDSEFDEVTQADTTLASGGPDDLSRTGPTEGDASEEDEGDLTAADRDDELERSAAENQPTPPGLPAGFRVSSLARWFYDGTKTYPGRQFTLQSALQPKLTASCMSLQDGWGCTTQIRPVLSRVEKLVQLQKCQIMPTGLPVTVLDRFVRLCLFDGNGPVSNIHTVRAIVAKDDRAWSFGTRVDAGSSLDYGEVYMRYNCASNQVRLLLEATIVCKSEATGSKAMELSIGHVVVPVFDETGGALPAKAYDLQFEGGTPFDQQQEVDPSLGQSGGSTPKGGASARSQPRIQLKLSVPNKETKEFMDTCPGTILGNLANLQLHSLYRQILASELSYSSRVSDQSARPIYAPHLVQFPAMVDQPDLMDVIRKRWNDFAKRDRAFKKPVVSEVMKQEFVRIAKSTFFLNQVKDFQPYIFGDKAQEQFRANSIQDFLRKIATDQTAVNFSLSADLAFEPFSMDEVTLPIIGQFPMPVLPVAVE